MAKKQDAFYFENFSACVECACEAAHILEDTLKGFDASVLEQRLFEIHTKEHEADGKKHEMLEVLVKAFITPIEREDILQLSQNIDEMVDMLDDVLQRVYCCNVTSVRPDAIEMTSLIVKSCEEVRELMREFADFKHSKKMHDYVIRINTLEEDADKLYIAALRKLHTESTDAVEVFVWHELYGLLEKCMDACEHVADVVESVVMKNS